MSDDGSRARRQLALAALACAVGALVQLLAVGRTWVSVAGGKAWSGNDLTSAVRPLSLAALAGAVALVATRRWGRVAVGALLVLVAIGSAAAAIAAGDPDAGGTLQHHEAWPVLAVVGAVPILLAGAAGAVRGRRWSEMSARYEAPGARRERDPEVELWEALDRGDDPTG